MFHYALKKGPLTAGKQTFNELKLLEREPLRYCKYDGNVTFTRSLLMLSNVTCDKHANALERYWNGDTQISKPEWLSFQN